MIKKLKLLFAAPLIALVLAVGMPPATQPVEAAPILPTSFAAKCADVAGGSTLFGIPPWYNYLECDTTRDNAIENFEFPADIWLVAVALVEMLTKLAAYIAVGYIVWAGAKFILAQGNPEAINNAKDTLQQAIIGLFIALLATSIVVFIGASI